MSIHESKFIKWFAGIAASLIVLAVIGIIGMYQSQSVNASEIKHNSKEINETRDLHNADADKIGERIDEVKQNQTIMMEDIKDILKNMPK